MWSKYPSCHDERMLQHAWRASFQKVFSGLNQVLKKNFFPLNITIITSTQLRQGNKDKSSFGGPDVPATSNNCLLNLAVLKRCAGITCNSSVCKSSKTIAKSGKPTRDTLYRSYNGLIREVCGILMQDPELSPALTNRAHLIS